MKINNVKFIIKILRLYIIGAVLLIKVEPILADAIKVPVGSQTPELQQIERPSMGTIKSRVKSQLGEPLKENPAKGNPAISSWEYAEFIVYFENDHVIHSVLKQKPHENKDIILRTTDEMPEDDLKLK